MNKKIVVTDATMVTVNRERNYVRTFSMGDTVIYQAMKSKPIPALKKTAVPEHFSGIHLHNHETALYHFERGM